MAHPHDAPEPTADTPTAKPHHTVEEASRLVLAGLNMMRPRLSHGPGCPAEHLGPCTCGFSTLLEGAEELVDALTAPPPPETHRKHG